MPEPMSALTQAKSNRRKGGNDAHRRLVKDPVRYKTMLCANWQAHGCCPYGFKCQFAHGQDELRARGAKEHPPVDPPRRRGRGKDPLADVPPSPCEVTPPLAPALHSTPGREVPHLCLTPPAVAPSSAMGELRLDWAPTVARGFANSFPPPIAAESSASSLSSADSPYRPPPSSVWASAWACDESRLSGGSGARTPSLRAESERESDRDADADDEIGEMLRCNATTGAVEIAMPPGVDKQASHHTVSVRRQISQLFEEDSIPILPPKTPKHELWFGGGVWSAGGSATPQAISLF